MSLQNLLKLQQQKKAANNAEAGVDPANVRATESPERTAPESVDADQSAPVQEQAAATPAEAAPATTPKSGGLGLRRLGQLGAVRAGAERRAESAGSTGPSDSDNSSVDGPAEFSLDDIASFDESSTPALRPTHEGFADEIEATAPDRDLPAELTTQQLNFVEQLDGIYGVLSDPEMFAQSVRLVMMELQENKEYIKLVSDQDVHTMLRGMRNSMGLARVKKQEKSRKAGGTTKKAARKTSAETDNALALLDSLGLGDD